MKIAIKYFKTDAMKWIYQGYFNAFKALGHEVSVFYTPQDIVSADIIFDFLTPGSLEHKDYEKLILFVTPNRFPGRWNEHENYVSKLAKSEQIVAEINNNSKILKWTFCNNKNVDFWDNWEDVKYYPLAFDHKAYTQHEFEPKYDVYYCGGWANNGYNTKKKRIISHLSEFKDKGLKTGFFINKGISHSNENYYLANSRVCVNIHDDYQIELGLDTNERTFKALGLGGVVVSDRVEEIAHLNLPVILADDPYDMYIKTLEAMNTPISVRKSNKELILENHCYIHRARKMLEDL